VEVIETVVYEVKTLRKEELTTIEETSTQITVGTLSDQQSDISQPSAGKRKNKRMMKLKKF